jgi:hypothetical protein
MTIRLGKIAVTVAIRYSPFLLALVFGVSILHCASGAAQEIKGRREAFGRDRAAEVEALLHSLFPEARVEWDTVLAIRTGSDRPTPVDLGNYTSRRAEDGSIRGVAALEVGTTKLDYIEKLKKFGASIDQDFGSTIVAFRIAPSGSIETKKLPLDPYDPLTRIAWFEVRNFSGEWPVLRLRYESYVREGDGLAILEWDSVFDAGTGSFLGRIPAGMVVFHKNGEPTQSTFSVHRTSPGSIEITVSNTGKAIDYPCSSVCVVDARTFLARLPQ